MVIKINNAVMINNSNLVILDSLENYLQRLYPQVCLLSWTYIDDPHSVFVCHFKVGELRIYTLLLRFIYGSFEVNQVQSR